MGGLVTAREFIAAGADVAVIGRNKNRLLEAKKGLGGNVLIFQSDA
ncbi:hypothetical protein [Snodgrassella alvi]|nr:hypothetical protein [Snodgrassella alvi]